MRINIGPIKMRRRVNIGPLKIGVKKVYPELEDLEVTPSGEEQEFKSSKYGFNEVKVKGVKSEEINIIPSAEEQVKEGLYNKVRVAGDENLIADNIKEGTSIFGVEGNAKTTNVKITDTQYLFAYNARLNYINEILALCENVTNTSNMFYYCNTSLEFDLSNFDTSNVTNMTSMFHYCTKLTKLDLSSFDTSNVKSMQGMFNNCTKLTELDLSSFDMSNVENIQRMFYYCSSLTELDLSSFDMSNVHTIGYIFSYCDALTNLISFKNLGKRYNWYSSSNNANAKLDLSRSSKLTYESLMNVITNGLYDLNITYNVANGGTLYTQQLVLGSTNLAKLTAEEIAIATNKGWSVS